MIRAAGEVFNVGKFIHIVVDFPILDCTFGESFRYGKTDERSGGCSIDHNIVGDESRGKIYGLFI